MRDGSYHGSATQGNDLCSSTKVRAQPFRSRCYRLLHLLASPVVRTRWLLALAAVMVLAAASIAIAARGGEEEKTTKGTNLSALRCPLEPTGKTGAGGQPEMKPAKDAFDTAELLGMGLADARAKAGEGGCDIVVSVADGAGQPVPIELNPKLIYVYTEKGRDHADRRRRRRHLAACRAGP